MGRIREFLTQDAGAALDRMNEPWVRFATSNRLIAWLLIVAGYGFVVWYAGWRVALFIAAFGLVVVGIGYSIGRRQR